MTSLDDLNIPYFFRPRQSPIPGEYRPWWRLVLVMLMLKINGRGLKLGFKQLQILDWSLRSQENYDNFTHYLKTGIFPISSIISVDPALNRAVSFGVGKKLLKLSGVSGGCRVELEPTAVKLLDSIMQDEEILSEEITWLSTIGKKLSGSVADQLLS